MSLENRTASQLLLTDLFATSLVQRRPLSSSTVKPAYRMIARNVPLATSLWPGTVKRRCGETGSRRII